MLLMIGLFHIIIGITGIASSPLFVNTPSYVFKFSLTTWGWLHLLVGIIVGAAGFGVFSGAVWARTVGVIVAALSMVANFAFLPYYPLWATLIIAVDIACIWALTTHGRDIVAEERY
jgi:hypothetical protein